MPGNHNYYVSSTKVLVHNGPCPGLKSAPSFKHTEAGWGSLLDVSDEVAQGILDKSITIGNKRFGYYEGKIYQFMNDNAGGWHGFLADYTHTNYSEAVTLLNKKGVINKKTAKKLRNGKQL